MSGDPQVPEGSRAILIGVPRYQDPAYPSHTAVGNSVDGVFRLLVESGLCGWCEEQVTRITDPINAGQLMGQLRDLGQRATGVLLLYFVGHSIPSEQGELCLAIADTDHANPDSTGLEYAKIKRLLYSGTPAVTKIAILDCCYSGRAIGLGSADNGTQLAELSDCTGAYTLTAADERAHTPTDDDSDLCTGFTAELLDLVMREGIPRGPQGLTLATIFTHLRQRLTAKGLPRPNQRSDDAAAAFVFARNAATVKNTAAQDVSDAQTAIGRAEQAKVDAEQRATDEQPHQERSGQRQEAMDATKRDQGGPPTPDLVAKAELPTPHGLGRRSVLSGPSLVALGVLAIGGLLFALLTSPDTQHQNSRDTNASSAITLAQTGRGVAFSPDGKTLVSNTEVGLTLWDVAKHVQTATFIEPATKLPVYADTVAFSPDGRTILTSRDGDRKANLWDARTHTNTSAAIDPYIQPPNLDSLAFSPDGKTVGTAGMANVVSLWNTAAPTDPPVELHEQVDFGDLAEPNGTPLEGHVGNNSIAFSPDGSLVATGQGGSTYNSYTHTEGHNTGSLQLWDAHTHHNIATLTASDPIYGLAFSPDSTTLASAGDTGITLWGLSDHKKISTTAVDNSGSIGGETIAVAFSPNGKTLAGAAKDGVIMLWNRETNTQTKLDNGHFSAASSLAFSPDGKLLATAGGSRDKAALRLWPVS